MAIRKFWLLFCLLSFILPGFAAEIGGNPKGNITLVEFFDYQCPHCRGMANTIDGLIKNNPDLRVEYRVIPIFGQPSVYEAKAALAAGYQNKFKNFHQLLMYQQGSVSSQEILSLAKQADLNEKQLVTDMHKPAIEKALNENLAIAKSINVGGVPTYLIGPTKGTAQFRFDGEVPYDQLQDAINKSKNNTKSQG